MAENTGKEDSRVTYPEHLEFYHKIEWTGASKSLSVEDMISDPRVKRAIRDIVKHSTEKNVTRIRMKRDFLAGNSLQSLLLRASLERYLFASHKIRIDAQYLIGILVKANGSAKEIKNKFTFETIKRLVEPFAIIQDAELKEQLNHFHQLGYVLKPANRQGNKITLKFLSLLKSCNIFTTNEFKNLHS